MHAAECSLSRHLHVCVKPTFLCNNAMAGSEASGAVQNFRCLFRICALIIDQGGMRIHFYELREWNHGTMT
jgi:hypothetical protein